MSSKKPVLFLGFTKNEFEILTLLKESGAMRPVNISRSSSVKRTTTNYALKKLLEWGVISKIRVGGHYEWQMADKAQIKKKVDTLYDLLNIPTKQEKVCVPAKIGVEVLLGKENIKNSYRKILNLARDQRVYSIEGNRATKNIGKLGNRFLEDLQQQYRNKKIILEGIIGYQTLEYFKKLPKKFLETYRKRLVVSYVTEDELVDFDMNIFIHGNVVVMINHEKEMSVIIENDLIKETMFSLYESLKSLSKKIDLNKIIEEIMEEN